MRSLACARDSSKFCVKYSVKVVFATFILINRLIGLYLYNSIYYINFNYAPKENEGKKAEQLKKDVSDNEKGKSNARSKEDSTGKAGGVAVHVRKRKTVAKK